MRQWIGLIIVLGAAYFLWTKFGDDLKDKREPASPDVAWYLEEVDHHFATVPERGGAWFFRGFHTNTTQSHIASVTVRISIRDGKEWDALETIQLGALEIEQRKTFDRPITVPKDREDPKLRWEIITVRRR